MKKDFKGLARVVAIATVILALVVSGCPAPAPPAPAPPAPAPAPKAEPVVMRITSDAPVAPHPKGAAIDWFQEELEKRIPGSEVRVYHVGSLFSDPDAVEALAMGTLEACWGQAGKIAGIAPLLSAASAPFLFSTKEAMVALPKSEFGVIFSDIMETKGVKTLGYGYLSMHCGMATTWRVLKPEDIAGKKLRIFAKIAQEPMVKLSGGSPTVMAWSEVPSALAAGTVDGGLTSTGGWRSIKDLVPFYTSLGFGGMFADLYPFWVSLKWWKTLTPETQKVIAEVAAEACLVEQGYQDADDKAMIEKYGTDDPTKPGIYVLSPEEQEVWRALLLPAVYDAMAVTMGKGGKELLAKAVEHSEKYAAK